MVSGRRRLGIISQRSQERSEVWQRARIINANSLSKNLYGALTTWRWAKEQKRKLANEWVPAQGKVHGLSFRGAKAYKYTIIINFWVRTIICAAEHNQKTGESRQRGTSLEFSVYVLWGAALPHILSRHTVPLNLDVINCTQLPPLLSFLSQLPHW